MNCKNKDLLHKPIQVNQSPLAIIVGIDMVEFRCSKFVSVLGIKADANVEIAFVIWVRFAFCRDGRSTPNGRGLEPFVPCSQSTGCSEQMLFYSTDYALQVL